MYTQVLQPYKYKCMFYCLTELIAFLLNLSDHEGMGRGRQPIKKSAQVRATGPERGMQAVFFFFTTCFVSDKSVDEILLRQRGARFTHPSSTRLSFLCQHFQSVLQTLEEQVAGERQRLVETHLARVESILNNNRHLAMGNYLTAVQSDPPQVSGENLHLLIVQRCNYWNWFRVVSVLY